MKKYTYNKTRYNIRVTTVGVFCILILIYALVKLYLFRNYLWFAIVIVCIYQIYNTFIAKAIPSEVELDEHRVSFKAYGKIKSFDFKQVNDFRVRYWPDTHKLFVRINKDNDKGPKGKHWIECRYFNDTLELYNFFIEKECQIHPNTAKTHAIRSNQLSIKEKEELQKKLEEDTKKQEEKEKTSKEV